jgi:hypothetical protein
VEYKKIFLTSLRLKVDFTKGSYACDDGGTEGVERIESVVIFARAGPKETSCFLADVDMKIGGESLRLRRRAHGRCCGTRDRLLGESTGEQI